MNVKYIYCESDKIPQAQKLPVGWEALQRIAVHVGDVIRFYQDDDLALEAYRAFLQCAKEGEIWGGPKYEWREVLT